MLRTVLSNGLRTSRLRAFSTVTTELRPQYDMFINGQWTKPSTGKYFEVEDPSNGQTLTSVALGDETDVHKAITVAQEAFEDGRWSRLSVQERATVLNKAAALLQARVPEFAEQEALQTGRAVREMYAQLGRLPEWFEYFAALIRTHEGSVPPFKGDYVNYVKNVPLGVVGQITPWNHPLLIAIKKIAPALAAGNSVVVKPSELAPCCVLDLAALCHEAGVPAGVLNVVTGFGAGAGKGLTTDPRIAKIDLTGGTETGKLVGALAGGQITGVISELGGKAPMLVFPDADLKQVINGAAFASFVAAGQTCIMGARMLIHESVYEEVKQAFVAKAKSIRLGLPMDTTTQMGPVISGPQLAKIESMVDAGRDEGATVLCGGKRPSDPRFANGYYYEPTVIEALDNKMSVVQEEIFGPVVVLTPFSDEQDAIAKANDSPFGLAAAVWTKNVARAHRVADRLDVGICWINDHHRNDPSSPWGGMKDSGLGRENGVAALHEYTQTKSVVVNCSEEPFDWFVEQEVRYS